ncbi:hypothetical protein LB360_18890, partial [Staphylococcus aureus]|nr:hypothetical protein [Staphylococcus aureus]
LTLETQKGQHSETCYPNEPVKKTVTLYFI